MEVAANILGLASSAPLTAVAGTPLTLGQVGLLAGVLGISVVLMISARRRRGLDAPSPRSYAREHVARLREENGVREDLEELLVRVQDVARELNAQLDTRFRKLEHILRESDARVAHLERLVRAAEGRPVCDVTVAGEKPADGPHASIPAGPSGFNPRYAPLYEMAAAGRSALEIAQTTGQPLGEVELLLALRPAAVKTPSLSVCG